MGLSMLPLFVLLVNQNTFSSGQQLQCPRNELQNVPLCAGDVIITRCRIKSPVLLWIIETEQADFEIDFNARNNIGDTEADGVFSANLTQHYPVPNSVSESILQFEFTTELNGITVICPNLLNQTLTISCVIGNSKISIPGHVNNIRTVQNSCDNLILWSEPDTGSTADHYMISTEPQINQCGVQGCMTTATQMQLIGLENGVNYDISVSACNCFACGPATTLQNIAMNLTETELIKHLIINRPVYTVEIFETGYAVTLYWEDTLCVTSYSVKVTYKNSKDENITSTLLNTYTHTALIKGNKFKVNVAGVNGNITGPYSPDLCINLDVPGNVIDLKAVNVTGTSSDGYSLVIEWKSPRNITCTQPSVDYYTVNYYNKTSSTAVNTNILIDLPSTMKKTINITVIPVNIIGMGKPKTVQVLLNGAITQTLSSVSLILVVIGLVTLL